MPKLLQLLLLGCLVFVVSIGCNNPQGQVVDDEDSDAQTEIKVNGPLRLLVFDDQSLASVLEREWRAISSHAIEVTNVASNDLLEQLDAGSKLPETDAMIFPSCLMGELMAVKALRPIPTDLTTEPSYQYTEILGLIRRRETQWNKQPYAVSFGSPTLVLLRRSDLVPDAPKTWQDLDAEVAQLKTTLPEDVAPLVQPFADGWASRLLLVRAASYLFDSSKVSTVFEFSSMKPRISSPPFVRAAGELASSFAGADQDLTPETALQRFLDGNAAMAITWPSAFRSASETPSNFLIQVSELPGSYERYRDSEFQKLNDEQIGRTTVFGLEGRLGAVSRTAKNAPLASIFLAWATNPTQSPKLCTRSQSSAPFRYSHQDSAERWLNSSMPSELGTRYFDVMKESLTRSEAFQFPRLPGQHKYMSALDNTLRMIVTDKAPVESSLRDVSRQWQDITKQYGLDKQKAAYRQSLGIRTDR